jgi:hypothetical protein
LERGERIEMIKQAARRLAEQSLTDRDLTLSHFDLPTAWINDYDNDYAYAVAQVSRGDDNQILDLHNYLFSDGGGTTAEVNGSRTWGAGAFRLFISHTHDHRGRASKLRDHLRVWDVDGFVAHQDIAPTREWENEIQVALRTCHAMCALITPDFVGSSWCDQEVGFAVGRGILVLPVKLGADPHGFIGKYQAITVPESAMPSRVSTLVFDALAINPLTSNAMAPAIVHRYANSRSFESTREAFTLLQTIPESGWTEAMIEQAERAAKENSQVEHANLPDGRPVPAATEELLKNVRGETSPPPMADDDIPF